jgi:NADH-quinone oxidoreductase subunit E
VDIEAIAQNWRNRPGMVTGALHALQQRLGYLDEEGMKALATALEVPPSQVYSVATFYSSFRLAPIGRSHFQVCHGTACHVRGAVQLSEKLERDLDLATGGTTPDGNYSLEEVRCLGCCGLAPVVQVNEVIHGRMNQIRLGRLIRPNEDKNENPIKS